MVKEVIFTDRKIDQVSYGYTGWISVIVLSAWRRDANPCCSQSSFAGAYRL